MVIIDLDGLRVNIPVLNLRYLFHCCVVLLKRDLSIISYVSVILLVCNRACRGKGALRVFQIKHMNRLGLCVCLH